MSPENEAPVIYQVHVTTDADGHTVTHRCQVPSLSIRRTISDSPPMWATEPNPDPVSRSVWVMPPGWEGRWHRNPQRQLVVPLSGSWWVRTQDGVRTVMGPGRAHLGDDLEAVVDAEGRCGHDSGTEGGEPVVLLMIAVGGQRQPCVGVITAE